MMSESCILAIRPRSVPNINPYSHWNYAMFEFRLKNCFIKAEMHYEMLS